MSLSAVIQSAGFAVLQVTDGEPLSCPTSVNAAASIVGVVNRNIVKGKDFMRLFRDAPVDFDITGLTEIAIDKTLCSAPPEAGQLLVDTAGFGHRIRYVTQNEIVWVVYCTPSSTTVI